MAWYRTGGGGGSQPTLITKSITQNGTYNASSDGADGYSEVEVNVSGGGTDVTQFRYIKMTISAINGGTHLQMSEIGFKTNGGTRFSMPAGYTATSSLPMFDPSLYSIDYLFDSNTNTKIVITWTAGTSVEDITIDLGSGNYLDIEDYPYFFWSSSDDDSQYQGRTPRTFMVVGANQSDFSDSVILVDEPILEKITTNRTEAYRVKMSINGIIPAKTLLYSLEQTQGGQWLNTGINTTQYDKLLFINSVNGDDGYMREIAISDIIVVNSGTANDYTEVFSEGAIGKMFICHIYNNELWVGYNASGASGNVVSVYNEISGGSTPTLITKSITENGTYNASSDSADGYSEVTVNVAGNLSRLVYLECVVKDSQVIPPVKTLSKEGDFDTYLSFDDSTRKFTVLTTFNAIVVPWVRQNETAVNPPKGYFYVNDTEVYSYTGSSRWGGAKGGVYDYIKFTAGDIFWVKSDYPGFPQQCLKVYKIENGVTNFADETAQ